jgi:hypothetical protein
MSDLIFPKNILAHDAIIAMTKNENILFSGNGYKKILLDKSYPHAEIYDYIKNTKIKENDSVVLIFKQYLFNVNNVIMFLKKHHIKKIYFFIDDVFRLPGHKYDSVTVYTDQIEKNINKVKFLEIENIKKIIKKTGINDIEVYHCEIIPDEYKKYFDIGVEIKYFDPFLVSTTKHYKNYSDLIIFSSNFNYKISCLNRRFEVYRNYIAALLLDREDVFLTLCQTEGKNYLLYNTQLALADFNKPMENLLIEKITNSSEKYICLQGSRVIPTENIDDTSFVKLSNEDAITINHIKNSFLHIVTETRYNSPFNYISEKSLKPINAHRPFLVLSSPGHLKIMREMGFVTFAKWWDESYDLEKNHHRRFEMVYEIVENILSKPKEELEDILLEMKPTLEYNQKLLNDFLYQDLIRGL